MKAPEKIYIQIDDTINFISQVFTQKPVGGTYFRDVKYICKDTLLEWLKDMIDYSLKERQEAYQNVIDKINSL